MDGLKAFILLASTLLVVDRCWATPHPVSVKRYAINLDLAPEQRWSQVVQDFQEELRAVPAVVSQLVPQSILPAVEVVAADLDTYLPSPFAGELRGIAQYANLSLGDVVLVNLAYDFSAFCTSIVAETTNGSIFHGRNLDYSFGNTLRSITIVTDFQQGGKTVYTATTYAGYAGILTGQRPHAFTVSVDERHTGGNVWENLLVAVFEYKKVVPVSFLVRETLATDGINFRRAVSKLANATLMAPVYFIVGGVSSGEGAIITRDRLSARDVYYLNTEAGRWYVLETNYDHWTTPPASDDRRDPAAHILDSAGRSQVSPDLLVKVLNTPPVLNDGTTYTTVMSAGEPDVYQAWKQLLN